ncbi:MAG: RAMP superfamily CRISPR-associated protein [Rhizobium sp.]
MARAIVERLVLEGALVLTSPLSVGGGEETWICDVPVALNGAGDVVIPGTSIAGALRSWFDGGVERKDDAFRTVWGFIKDDSSGGASHLVFHDAVMESGILEMRDHVGIDRVEGRAADNIKFDRQSVARGARFRFRLSADVPANEIGERVKDAMLHIRDILSAGTIHLGGATTRGYGAVKLEGATLGSISLRNRAEFLAALAGSVAQVNDLAPAQPVESRARLVIRIRWTAVGPVMIKASEEGLEIKIVPLTTEVDGKQIPIIPGSSIKGVMRAMAERIMATVCKIDQPTGSGGLRFRQMMGEDFKSSDRLVTALFGAASEDAEPGQTVRRRGKAALGFSDARAKESGIPSKTWRQVTDEMGGIKSLREHGRREMHVAIDRFTAAPADGKLFSSLSLIGMQYTDMKIELSPERLSVLDAKEQAAALALLLLVLREMADGQVPIGSGSTRGHGMISVDGLSFSLEGSTDNAAIAELAGLAWEDFLKFVDGQDMSSRINAIVKGWRDYINPVRDVA